MTYIESIPSNKKKEVVQSAMKIIATNIRVRQAELGRSNAEVYLRAGIGCDAYRKLIQGARASSIETIVSVAMALDIKPLDLFKE